MNYLNNALKIINENSIIILIILTVITILLIFIVISLYKSVKRLDKKCKMLMRGTNNKNLEEIINSKLEDIDNAIDISNEALRKFDVVREEMKGCLNKISIIRYNAFDDVGSDLSFSIAILDSYNNGIILTSIYSREGSIAYAKPINNGESTYKLSEEETTVLNEAINKYNEIEMNIVV